MTKNYIVKRGNNYYYFRRVPSDLAHLDNRRHIRISLKTKDYTKAIERANIQNKSIEKFWKELLEGKHITSDKKNTAYKDAVKLARAHGFVYKHIDDLVNASMDEIVTRLNYVEDESESPNPEILENALTGKHRPPDMLIMDVVQDDGLYWQLCAHRLRQKSDNQIRKWKNPRKKSARNFIKALGENKNIPSIDRKDILKFQRWWLNRIHNDNLNPETANKDFIHLKDIIRTCAHAENLDIDPDALFAKVTLKSNGNSRLPYAPEFVKDDILKNLGGLNPDARFIVQIMADTGARISEVVGLAPKDIVLNSDIPYIWIRPGENRTLKTDPSNRQIPLVGSALKAAQENPDGVTRYQNPDSASNLINDYLGNHNLRPEPGQSLYSLRHTFKDRLRDAGAPEEIIDDLMGHQNRKPKYGRGHLLETKLKWLEKIAYV